MIEKLRSVILLVGLFVCFFQDAVQFSSPIKSSSSIEPYLHSPQQDPKDSHSKQRETGMFRSKWFAYREFYDDSEDEHNPEHEFGVRDRICLRFYPNRTIKIYSKKLRPLIQMGEIYLCGLKYGNDLKNPLFNLRKTVAVKKEFDLKQRTLKIPSVKAGDRRKLSSDLADRLKQKEHFERDQLFEVDGTFSSDLDSETWVRLKADIRDYDADCNAMRTRYEVSYTWGKVDAFAQRFQLGRMYRFPNNSDKKKRLGAYLAGVVSICSNPHRPVLSRDCVVFQ